MEVFSVLLTVCVCASLTAALGCSSNEIACANKDACVVLDYICDGQPDCDDASDEKEELCKGWLNARCPVKSVLCTRNGENYCMEIPEYCTSSNPPCEGDLDKRICWMLEGRELQKLSNFDPGANLMKATKAADELRKVIPSTISHERCPPLYTLVGDSCVSFLFISSMTWSEARVLCNLLDGDLVTFHRDANQFAAITQHLQTLGLDKSFWIGGSLANPDAGWTWVDGSPMVMGTPFWASAPSGTFDENSLQFGHQYRQKSGDMPRSHRQRPGKVPRGSCASLSFEFFFFITDEDCLDKKSPLCVSRTKPTPKHEHHEI